MLLDKLSNRVHGTNGKKTAKKTSIHHRAIKKHGEKANFRRVFFGKNKNRQKVASVEENNSHTHKKRQSTGRQAQRKERRKKDWLKLMAKKKKSITYYIKSIFSR